MVAFADLSLSFLLGLSVLTAPVTSSASLNADYTGNVRRSTVCQQIASQISSSSKVYYFGSTQYMNDNYHWASSSSQNSECSFEPATAGDIGIALQILGQTRTPFGIKSGGHATNAGFSSTPGVQIAMYSFSDVVYNSAAQTATVGTGLLLDDVYVQLEKYGVTILGTKVTGIGIGGVFLGGGYSHLTNQYGLAIDSVTAFELVLPNGTVTNVDSTNSDLFFALRGGFNNFGIVTRVTVKTYPQGQVWGGLVTYSPGQWEAASSAITNFWANVNDPKASIYNTYNFADGVAQMSSVLFYDAPTCPKGIFDDFLNAPHIYQDVSTRSYLSLVQTLPLNITSGHRSVFHSAAMEKVTMPVLDMVINETMFWGAKLVSSSALMVSYEVDLYVPTIYTHVDSPTAYPPSRNQGYSFIEVYYSWQDSNYDATMFDAVDSSVQYMTQVLTDGGQDIANIPLYPNNAPPSATLEQMYGDNVPRLQAIKKAVDPNNVMGLTGGWKF
ncbi:FAD dependent oxidoreductase [Suillus decipiens]|nr:FAD dependent oxidoreductase [Suillus decipiens]